MVEKSPFLDLTLPDLYLTLLGRGAFLGFFIVQTSKTLLQNRDIPIKRCDQPYKRRDVSIKR
jgi:hypothetical protein